MKKTIIMAMLMAAAVTGSAADPAAPEYKKLPAGERAPVLMLGDSMMRLLGKALEKEFKKNDIEAKAFSSLGSGLARLDAFDWYAKIKSLLDETHAKTVIVTLGANDRQTLLDEKGNMFEYGTPGWRTEYSTRVGKAMDTLISNGTQHVIWLMLPDMKERTHQDYAQLANVIYAEQAAVESRKDKVVLYDMRPLLTKKPGTYSSFIMSPQGEALNVRDADGVHLTSDGSKLVAKALLSTFCLD